MIALLALAAAVPPPQPGELKTFRDWTVGCDNGRACKAVGLMSEAEDAARESFLRLAVRRDADRAALPVLTVEIDDMRAEPFTLLLDGVEFARFVGKPDEEVAIPLSGAQIATLAKGGTATVGTSRASLSGLAAALRYIDEMQRRAGHVTAMVATGPAMGAIATLPLPVVTNPARATRPARTLTVARATQLIGRDNAVCDYSSAKVEPEAFRLDARTSLVTVVHPCGNGAYNFYTSAFLIDEAGKVRAATFDTDKPNPKDGENMGLVNSGYDAETRRLSSFMKGRGLGDCGVAQEYAWDGKRFRLVEQSQMGECRGSIDYIRTWRATVR